MRFIFSFRLIQPDQIGPYPTKLVLQGTAKETFQENTIFIRIDDSSKPDQPAVW